MTHIWKRVKRKIPFFGGYRKPLKRACPLPPALQLAQLFQNVQTQAAPQETSPEDDENFETAMAFINSL